MADPSASRLASSFPVCRAHSLSGKRSSCREITSTLLCLRWKKGETISSSFLMWSLYSTLTILFLKQGQFPISAFLSTCNIFFQLNCICPRVGEHFYILPKSSSHLPPSCPCPLPPPLRLRQGPGDSPVTTTKSSRSLNPQLVRQGASFQVWGKCFEF